MSRVLFVSLNEGEVVASCLAAKVAISAIEHLPAGGTRFVCTSGDGAEIMKKKMKRHILGNGAVRQGYRPDMPTW